MSDGAGAAAFVKQRTKQRPAKEQPRRRENAAAAGGRAARTGAGPRGAAEGPGDGARRAAAGVRRGAGGGRRDLAACADGAVFAGVLGLIVVTPWFRGLFFPMEQMVALLVALGLFAARWWSKFTRNDYGFLRGPLDWAVFGLWLAYLASTFVAANVRDAIQADIKYLLYFIAYWLVRELATDERRRAMVQGAVAVTGVWVSILGVGAAAGTFQFNGAFDGMRIYSAFQYPNTLASYLMAAFFCALALWSRAGAQGGEGAPGAPGGEGALRRAWPAFLWAAAAYACLFVFVFTYSRGALLVFPAVAAAFVALQPKGARLGSALAVLLLALAAGVAGRGFPAAVAAHDAVGAWGAFLVGVPLALAANLALLLFSRVPGRQRIVALGALAGAGLAAAAFLLVRLRLPAEVLARISSIGLGEHTARLRLDWMMDALRIIKDHPLLGAGGGGWNALYHQYQNYAYSSTEVHNHFMQVWVETGTVGFLLFLAIWVSLAWSGWKAWRAASGGGRRVLAGAGAGALALGLHSAIDFNLSLAAVSLALWSLLGSVRSAGEAAEVQGRAASTEYRLLPRLLVYLLASLGFVGVLSLALGFDAGRRAAMALDSGRPQEARLLFESAIARDPFQPSYHVDLAQTYQVLGLTDPAYRSLLPKAVPEAEKGLRLAPENARYLTAVGIIRLRAGAWQEGLAALEKAKKVERHQIVYYENLAGALIDVARQKILSGDAKTGAELLQRALDLKDEIAGVRSLAPDQEVAAGFVLPDQSPILSLRWGQARAMRGEPAEAESLLAAGAGHPNPGVQAEALVWLGAIQEAQGRTNEAAASIGKADGLAPGRAKDLDQVRRLLGAVGPKR